MDPIQLQGSIKFYIFEGNVEQLLESCSVCGADEVLQGI